MLTGGWNVLQTLMKEYKFDTKHCFCPTFLQQKRLFTVPKYSHALEGTACLSHCEIWEHIISAVIVLLRLNCVHSAALITSFWTKVHAK